MDEGLGGSSRFDEYQKKTSDRDEDSESLIEAQTRRTFFPSPKMLVVRLRAVPG